MDSIALKAESLSKSFGKNKAVDNVNFEVKKGEIFGLLGPNGAGKTTTIRMLLDLIENHEGKVTIFGSHFNEKTKDIVAYLPEERGLYKNMTPMQAIKYLASLKGVSPKQAEKRALELMEEMDLLEHKNKKIFQLSKGTQQKMQIIGSLIHNPSLLILDEPFSGLDPLSVKFVIGVIEKEKEKGKTIVLSTHNMHIAESICERVVLINKGRRVLYGEIPEIKETYSRHSILVEFADDFSGKMQKIQGVKKVVTRDEHTAELLLELTAKPEQILKELVKKGIETKKFEITSPSLESIFLAVVEAEEWIKY